MIDIIRNALYQLNNLTRGDLEPVRIALTLGVTFLISLLVFFIYRKTYDGVVYNRNYNISLIVVALVTSLIIMSVMTNLALSLGMVGALTIVRFRTAIKEPLDIAFMFWSIGIGVATGAGFFTAAIIGLKQS